jgi:hypothetical protein
MAMKKVFPIALMVLGLVFVGAGIYTVNRGFDARDQVRDELVAQKITTPEDASIPNVEVTNAKTAIAMADIIEEHAMKSTGGKTYSELDREDPKRQVAFNASTLRTSLYTSAMAFNVADLVVGIGALLLALGVAIGGVGVALAGLVIPRLARRVHIEPVTAA